MFFEFEIVKNYGNLNNFVKYKTRITEKSKNSVSEDLQVEKVLVFSLSPPSGVETSTRLGMLSDVEVYEQFRSYSY